MSNPARYWPELHGGWSTHLKPLAMPLQVPVLYCSEAVLHLLLEHAVHVPLSVLEAPKRNVDPGIQLGWVVHFPLVVLDAEARYWLLVQVGWMRQVPFLEVLKSARYWAEAHCGWSTHLPWLVDE